jgi:tetratricopeptide (TPR) repeat protein
VDSRSAAQHSALMVQELIGVGYAELERRAQRLESERRLEEARDAFDAALKLNPSAQSSAEGRARIALALREEKAPEHCARALAFHQSNPERQLRMILTSAAELGSTAIPLFEEFIRRNPEDGVAHEALSELRAEWGAGDHFIDNYAVALNEFPTSKPLLMSYWNTLTRARRLDEALHSMDAHRTLFRDDRDFVLLEMNIANHGGHTDRAAALIDRLDDRPDALLARGQFQLQTGQPHEAAKLLEAVVQIEPDNLSAWALLELAWRILGDPRHEWLVGQPGLYGAKELTLTSSQLNEVAAALRKLHGARSQPIGQSVRRGTQTAGQLFLRNDPEILLLTDALAAAIREFVAGLPDADPAHPLLKHRDMGMAFGPSWSIRLTGGGYHAAHFHPNGILSSACYIALPGEGLADPDEKPGWLEIGRPPPELAIDLPPLASFEPKPGRLILFPSFLFHGTRHFAGGERLTVAFDLVPVPMD